ncbi:MAG: hypothetical protein GXO54_03580 [Chloroflexi bacterium]|nr:hypothetical protein [Chloroflexota bacterium]
MRARAAWLGFGLTLWALLACNAPFRWRVTPTVSTPDLTLTALFQWPTPSPFTPGPAPAPATPSIALTPWGTPVIPTPTGPVRDAPTVYARRATVAPIIDGNLTDWPEEPWFEASHVIFGIEHWMGPSDASARFALMWNADALYLAARVTDDQYVQLATGFSLFKGDALEIVLDTDLPGDFTDATMNSDDYHLGFSPGYGEPGVRTEAYLWFPEALRGPRTLSVDIAARRVDQGYVVEIRLPWSLVDMTPQPGGYYGFAFRVSDNDAPGQQVQQSMVSNVPLPHVYNDPTTWGNLVLLP